MDTDVLGLAIPFAQSTGIPLSGLMIIQNMLMRLDFKHEVLLKKGFDAAFTILRP